MSGRLFSDITDNMNTSKTKLYIWANSLLISLNLAWNYFTRGPVPAEIRRTTTDILHSVQQLENNPLIILASLLYLLLFISGIINVLRLGLRKLQKRPFFPSRSAAELFPADTLSNNRALLLTGLFFFILNSVSFLIPPFKNIQQALGYGIALNLIMELATIGILLRLLSPGRLGLRKPGFSPAFVFTAYTIGILILIPASVLNSFLLRLFSLTPETNPAIGILMTVKNPLVYLLLFLQVIFVAPLAEELFFRGFLFAWLRSRLSFPAAAIFLSLIFALMHQASADALPLFILSLILCFVYERTGNLWNSILIHGIHNSLGSLIILALKNHSFM